jgi:hypothetical protein
MPGRTLGLQREICLRHAPLFAPSPKQHAEGYLPYVHEAWISSCFPPFHYLTGQISRAPDERKQPNLYFVTT